MSNSTNDRKAVVGFLRIMVVLVAILLIILLIIIFFGIMGQNKDESLGKDDVLDVAEVTTEEEVDIASDQEPVPNGDAAGIDPDSWMADKKIYDPQMTDSTMHLVAADMNKFDDIIANSAGNDTSPALLPMLLCRRSRKRNPAPLARSRCSSYCELLFCPEQI